MSLFKKNSKSQSQDKKGKGKGSSEQKSQIRLNKNNFESLPQDEGENPFSPVSKSTSASLMDAGGATATACSTQPALVCPASESPQHEDEFVDSEGHKKQKGRFKWSIKTKKEVPENEKEKHGKKKDKGKNKKGSTSSQEVEPQTATIQGVAPSPPTKGHSSDGSESHVLDSKQQDGHEQESKRKLDLQSDDLLMATVDDSQVFVGSNLGQLMVENETLKSQQEENNKIIAKLKEEQLRLAKELEQTKSDRKDVLQSEIALIQEKEASLKAQHEQLISDLEEAVRRKHAEVERLTGDHAKQVKAIQDDHSKKISQLHQEKQRSESEKEEEARQLQQELKEKEKLNQEKEERLKLLQRESVQFKERADHLETKLKEREVEQEVCALPPDHHMDEMRKLREELDNKYEQEINQLKATLKEKENGEEESREEVDRFHQELEKANEKHSEIVRQLCELKQENEQELNRLRQELTEATEKYNEDVKRLESELEEKNEQDVEKLRKELQEANTTHTKDVQRLNSELKRKDEQHAKEITEMKTEYEDKYRTGMHQKDAELQRKIKTQDAASNGLIRKLKNEVKGLSEKLKKDSESKDAVVTKLTKELEKTKQECQLKEHEKQQCVEAVKSNSERIQHDQKRQLEKEIETLREQLHEASAKLIAVREGNGETGVVQRLNEQLQEKHDELKRVMVEVETLRGSFAKLTTDYEHLQHLHQQLMVEANAKKELTTSSCDDPCDSTVFEPQSVMVSTFAEPKSELVCEKEASSGASIVSVKTDSSNPQDNLTDEEKRNLQQRLAEAQVEIENCKQECSRWKQKYDELLLCGEESAGEAEVHVAEGKPGVKEQQKTVPFTTFAKLRKRFGLLTERVVQNNDKYEQEKKNLIEKIEVQQTELRELRGQVGGEVGPPRAPVSLDQTGDCVQGLPTEEMSHEAALKEVKDLRSILASKDDKISNLELQIRSFPQLATEHHRVRRPEKEEVQVQEKEEGSNGSEVKQVINQAKSHDDAILDEAIQGGSREPSDPSLLTTWKTKVDTLEEERAILENELGGARENVEREKAENVQLRAMNKQLKDDFNTKATETELYIKNMETRIVLEQSAVMTEKEKVEDLEHQLAQVLHIKEKLMEDLKQYEGMEQRVKKMKDGVSCMFKKLLKSKPVPPEQENPENLEFVKKIKELMDELEVRKIEAQQYKDDFEEERKEREVAAGKMDDTISEMQVHYSETLEECKKLEAMLECSKKEADVVRQEHDHTKQELQTAKDLFEQTSNEAAKNIENMVTLEEKIKQQEQALHDTEQLLEHKQQIMKDELAKLKNEHEVVVCERDQLNEDLTKLQNERKELQKQIEKLCEENDRLEDIRKGKEKELEITAFEKNQLENEVHDIKQKSHTHITKLQTELKNSSGHIATLEGDLAGTNQQLEVVVAEKTQLNDESLAKTQQVKQYKKQVDNFRVQLQESNAIIEEYKAKLEHYQRDLAYCQRDLQAREEDEESKVAIVIAQHESEMSALNSELGRLRREKANVEEKLRQLQKGVIPPETANLVDNLEKEKTEWKHKYTHLRDRYDGVFQYSDQLAGVLKKHNIPVPMPPQMPNAQASRSPITPHGGSQMGQEGALHSLPADQYAYDGGPDKSMTSPAAIGPQAKQQFEYNQQLVVPGSSPPMPHPGRAAGGIQRQQYQSGYARQGDGVALGQQNRYQQGMQGQLGGGGVPRNPQRRMENIHGAGFGMGPSANHGIEPQGLVVATEESGQHERSGPQENALIQGINTEMHNVAAVVGRQVDNTPVLESLSPQAPLDPNLICPMCRRQFRIGEIQKYRQHVKLCHGT